MILLDLDDTLIDHSGAAAVEALRFGPQHVAAIPDYDSEEFTRRWGPRKPACKVSGSTGLARLSQTASSR